MNERPRYVTERTFPAYAFIPGQAPHPISHPDGHSYGISHPAPPPLTVDDWPQNREYLWGADLYNHGYPWEAHEAWEGLWSVAERGSVIHAHLQGLIQFAAAAVKARAGSAAGVASLTQGATRLLGSVIERAGSPHLGVDLDRFMRAFHTYAAQPVHWADSWPILYIDVPAGIPGSAE